MRLIAPNLRTVYREPANAIAARGDDEGRDAGGHRLQQCLGRAGAWHVAAGRARISTSRTACPTPCCCRPSPNTASTPHCRATPRRRARWASRTRRRATSPPPRACCRNCATSIATSPCPRLAPSASTPPRGKVCCRPWRPRRSPPAAPPTTRRCRARKTSSPCIGRLGRVDQALVPGPLPPDIPRKPGIAAGRWRPAPDGQLIRVPQAEEPDRRAQSCRGGQGSSDQRRRTVASVTAASAIQAAPSRKVRQEAALLGQGGIVRVGRHGAQHLLEPAGFRRPGPGREAASGGRCRRQVRLIEGRRFRQQG